MVSVPGGSAVAVAEGAKKAIETAPLSVNESDNPPKTTPRDSNTANIPPAIDRIFCISMITCERLDQWEHDAEGRVFSWL